MLVEPQLIETTYEEDFINYMPCDINFKFMLHKDIYCYQFNNISHLEYKISYTDTFNSD